MSRPTAGDAAELFFLERLEPRVLLSADALGTAFDLPEASWSDTDLQRMESDFKQALQAKTLSAANAAGSAHAQAFSPSSAYALDLDSVSRLFSSEESSMGEPAPARLELVLIDTQVPDYQSFIDQLPRTEGVSYVFHTLHAGQDGVEEVGQLMAQYETLDAVHIFSHAAPGELQLGGTVLSLGNLADYSASITAWRGHLSDDADILVYGCDLAGNASGEQLVKALAQLTGADLASSIDTTGHAAKAADWQLEYSTGRINAQLAVNVTLASDWQHTLATIVVTSSGDEALAPGVASVTELLALNEPISLREAISVVNLDHSAGSTEVHVIVFDLQTDHSIDLTSALPNIQATVVIDGTTEPDFVDTPVVRVTGAATVLTLDGDGITVRGLSLSDSGGNGVVINGNNNLLQGNHILSNAGAGVAVFGAGNTVGGTEQSARNVISGNADSGIILTGSTAVNNAVQGNYIGTTSTGAAAFANVRHGIEIRYDADANTIGGSIVGAGNVISGNGLDGIYIWSGNTGSTSHTVISGNIIGLDATGRFAIGNVDAGIELSNSPNNIIGGVTEAERNIVSGNIETGVRIFGSASTGNIVRGNYIGPSIDGSVDLGNGWRGITMFDSGYGSSVSRTLIGGSGAGEGNVISGNELGGIYLGDRTERVDIIGNFIGVAADGSTPMANGGAGITIITASQFNNFRSNDVLVTGNTIAFNKGAGITVENPYTFGSRIFHNSTYSNLGLNIDIAGDGVTANDALDADNGANALTNFPVIGLVSVEAGRIRIEGSLEYGSEAGTSVTVHFYYADQAHASGQGNAQQYIGSATYLTDSSRAVYFVEYFDTQVPSDSFITATVTSGVGTSEFSTATYLATGNVVNSAPTGTVAISGELVQGALLSASNTLSDANGRTGPLTYQWQRNGTNILNATGETYLLSQADVGAAITVTASYVDDAGFSEAVTSAAYGPVANINDSPVGSVGLSGVVAEDNTLSAVINFTDDDGLPTHLNYQWYRGELAIAGATDASYTLGDSDAGEIIKVVVSYTDAHGNPETVVGEPSAPVVNVNDLPTGTVDVLGRPEEGNVLSADINLTDADGLPGTYTYQWYRGATAIAGATAASYALVAEDVGSSLYVTVAYQDGGGTQESYRSAQTEVIAAATALPRYLGILGNPIEDEILTADADISDADGLSGPITYQWFRDGAAILGANGSSYVLGDDDVHAVIGLVASYTDDAGNAETVTASPTEQVQNRNDLPSGNVTISGNAREDDSLTAVIGIEDADGLPTEFNYQWLRDGVAIAGANQSVYVLGDADVGANVKVVVRYLDGHGTMETVSSTETGAVLSVNDAAQGHVLPEGAAVEDQTLTARVDITDADGLGPFHYQWFRNEVAVPGTTASSYTLSDADVGVPVHFVVSYVDGQGNIERIESSRTSVVSGVNDPATGSVALVGSPTEDQTLVVDVNLADLDGLPDQLNYQWHRDGIAITGATAPGYKLGDADVGSSIHVVVSYRDAQGTDESVRSAHTAPIANINDRPSGAVQIDGKAAEDATLTARHNLSDADGLSATYSYQWYRNGLPIADATSASYLVGMTDVGHSLSVAISYTDAQGTSESATSGTTAPVLAVNHPATGSVELTGSNEVGSQLHLRHTLADSDGMPESVQYLWFRNGQAIAGAEDKSYTLAQEDRGAWITVVVHYTDERGFKEVVQSNSVLVAGERLNPSLYYADESTDWSKAELQTPAPQKSEPVATTASEDKTTTQAAVAAIADLPSDQEPSHYGGERRVTPSIFEQASVMLAPEYLHHNNLSLTPASNDLQVLAHTQTAALDTSINSTLESVFPHLASSFDILQQPNFTNSLDAAVQIIRDNPTTLSAAVVGGGAAVSVSLSVGYVMWTLRSGVLVTSLLSSMPAWRFIDPLPILSGSLDLNDDADEDDESLESMVESTNDKGVTTP